MANEGHLQILRQGVEAWNQWREENPRVKPDLSGANLLRASLAEAHLWWADLRRSDLRQAYLRGAQLQSASLGNAKLHLADLRRARLGAANLAGARLDGADLTEAVLSYGYLADASLNMAVLRGARLLHTYLSGADLSAADLSGADLSRTYLGGVDFSRATLYKTDLRNATVVWTTFGQVDLSEVEGLETVRHAGPSTIGMDVIGRSKGKVPEVFLRGAGVPDEFIEVARSFVGKPIQYYSCFISYSHKDQIFAEKVYADLQARGVHCWYFPDNARWGGEVWEEIGRGIHGRDKVLLVCSENSLRSGPVLREIERALQREDEEGRNILFPITIDDHVFDCWEHPRKADVLSKAVGDLRNWEDPEEYQKAFERLLRDLKVE